ncbi:MAG TPA: redoxin domain-containing protein [bacterium]|nr:redoxin domain-containing protein [bacterium]
MGRLMTLVLAAILFGGSSLAQAARVGDPAPNFTATDSHGKTHKLSDFKGKYLVLEWHNQDCPFVVSQYKGKMQRLQDKWTKKGVEWLAIISSAPGKQGYVDAAGANADVKTKGAHVTATCLDPEGVIATAYGAKTTPHMFVINPKGALIYNGAIDNAPREDGDVAKNENGEAFVNYVDQALTEAMVQKKKVTIPSTPPYGCHVKYKD